MLITPWRNAGNTWRVWLKPTETGRPWAVGEFCAMVFVVNSWKETFGRIGEVERRNDRGLLRRNGEDTEPGFVAGPRKRQKRTRVTMVGRS